MRRVFALAGLALLAGACTPHDPVPEIEDRREPASEVLIARLGRGTAAERERAALAMGRIQSEEYVEPLVEATHDPARDVRTTALFALGQLGLALGAEPAPLAIDAVTAALDDPDPAVAASAVEALGKLAPHGAADVVTPLLRHSHPEVRTQAAHALFRLRFVPLWRREAEEPPPLPDTATDALAAALDDDDERVRQAAAHAFSRWGEPRAVPALVRALRDENVWVRLFAVRALGRSGDRTVAGEVLKLVADPEIHVRIEAIGAAGALGAADRLPLELDADDAVHVRAAVARALSRGSKAKGVVRLRALVADEAPTVAADALGSLAARLEDRYAPSLLARLDDPRWPVRVAAARAAGSLSAAAARPVLERAGRDDDARVRLAALETLGARPEGREAVLAALESDDLAVRGTAVDLLGRRDDPDTVALLERAWERSAGDGFVEVRESVADVLARREDAKAALVRIASEDPAPSVRRRARHALAQLGIEPPPFEDSPPGGVSPWLGVRFERDPTIVLETSKGTIEIRCLAAEAPVHVAAIVDLASRGFYDGLPWHRVVPNFVIQGGDPRGDGWGGSGTLLRDEISRTRFVRGAVGMPKAGKDTGGGQLFVTLVPTPRLEGNYTVFGMVVSGLDVIDRIEVGDVIERARVEGVPEGRPDGSGRRP